MNPSPPSVSAAGRYAAVGVAFLGWMCAGVQMGVMPLAALSVSKDLLGADFSPAAAGKWFGYFTAALSLGAACGGILLGWLGDRFGRKRAMAASILCYSVFAGLGGVAQTQEQLLALRFLTGLGIGGMWPNGVSLVSELWADVSRPFLAGAIGTSANLGMLLISLSGWWLKVTPGNWRALLLVSGVPALVGLAALKVVPESPRWLAARSNLAAVKTEMPLRELFRPPLLRLTLVGIGLGAVPLVGSWSSGSWLTPWADSTAGAAYPQYKSWTLAAWACGAAIGSFFGEQVASRLGRRVTYFLISLGSVTLTCGIFIFLKPLEPAFLPAVFLQGCVATLFFGWLPLCLPELFPTRVRASGTSLSYNVGRFAVAGGVLGTGALMQFFHADYAKAGAIMGTIYGLGMVVI